MIPLRNVKRKTYSGPLLVISRVRMAKMASGPMDKFLEPPRKTKTKQAMNEEYKPY